MGRCRRRRIIPAPIATGRSKPTLGARPRIARGGGYSYAPASFGSGTLVIDMRHFNRILRFEPSERLLEVEAGATLGELLAFTAPRGLWLAVQPGYPGITVGGCIASNAHGKNPGHEGTFLGSVADLRLFHPRHGTLWLRPGEPLFELTGGGLGLTGIVLSATLRLEPLRGASVVLRRNHLEGAAEGVEALRASAGRAELAYTWHSASPDRRLFGRGFSFEGSIEAGPAPPTLDASYRPMPKARWLRWGMLGPGTAAHFNRAFELFQTSLPATSRVSLFDALFPLVARRSYFLLFGRPGLLEYQALVPAAAATEYLRELQEQILARRPPSVMLSLKLFCGIQRYLRFDGNGICVTLDFARSPHALDFAALLDELTARFGGIPNVIKDSRLSASVVRACYFEYESFRDALRAHDPERLFRSELSERLML